VQIPALTGGIPDKFRQHYAPVCTTVESAAPAKSPFP
jgi:hypothetical protein